MIPLGRFLWITGLALLVGVGALVLMGPRAVEPDPVAAMSTASASGREEAGTPGSDDIPAAEVTPDDADPADASDVARDRSDDAPLPASIQELRSAVDRVLDQGRYRRATWGVLAVSLDRGDTLLTRNPDLPMVPASNLTFLTAAAALHYLGPDYRFPMYVVTDAPVVDGVVQGDLTLYGTGDPGVAARYHRNRYIPFRELAQTLKDAGITRVQGRVLGDGTFLPGPLLGEGWEPRDLNEWFAAPSGGLSFNENVASVRIRAETPGEPPEILTIPERIGLVLDNEASSVQGRGRRPLWLLRDSPEEPIRVVGELQVGARDIWRQMTVRDPALAAAHAFTRTLREWEIEVDGYPASVPDTESSLLSPGRVWVGTGAPRILATFRSPPIREYLTAVNQRSHNLYADLLLKTVGRVTRGEGSFPGGAQAVADYLQQAVQVDPASLIMHDGSGLSPLNHVRPGDLLATVAYISQAPEWDAMWESLPVAGQRSMYRRMSRTAASGNLRAKTGTMDSVSGMTGLVRTADGERIAFTILGNDLPSEIGAKRLEDRVGRLLAEWRR